jgi:hypothetical protein
VKYLSFLNSSFALRYFLINVNGKATCVTHPPCFAFQDENLSPKKNTALHTSENFVAIYSVKKKKKKKNNKIGFVLK